MGIIAGVIHDAEVAEVWSVHRGGQPKWWFRDKQLARDAAAGRGWYGGDAPVSKHTAIILNDSEVYLLKQVDPVVFGGPETEDERRKRAMDKLTESEKRLLGLAR